MRDTAAVDDMMRIEGGEFAMGSNDFYPEERPVRRAEAGAFLWDPLESTCRHASLSIL